MIDSITRITLNLQETNTMVSIRAKRGDTGRKLLIHLSDGSIPYHISDDCYATFTAKKPDGTKINNACTIENNVIEYEFTDQTCTAVGTMKAEIRLYGADDKMITSACFLVNVYDTVFRDGDEVGSETEMNTLDDLILRANAFLNETGKLLRWQGNWDSETEYEANDLVLHEKVLYVAEEAIAAGTVPGAEEVTAWVPIAGGADLVGIESVEQTTVSTADGGTNVVTVRLTNGKESEILIRNGMTGTSLKLTDTDKTEIAELAAGLVKIPDTGDVHVFIGTTGTHYNTYLRHYEEGKLCYCKHPAGYILLTQKANAGSHAGTLIFEGYSGGGLRQYQLSPENRWTFIDKSFTTEISASSTNADIPSAKAVYDAMQNMGGPGWNANQTIETVLSVDEVCVGKYYKGALDPTFKTAVAVKNFVKPFVVSATLTSADYQFAVDIYKNGVYVKTEGWLSNGTVYTFDHATYQYKLYIGQVVGGYVYDFDACRKSLVLTISTVDVLKSYNALEIQSDTERRNTKNAVEYMMRRNYDISYANAPAPIGLTTYVGNNQIVHPKVLYFPNKFGGYMYWMAYTPYPFANDVYENPCVAYSNDGYNWVNIDGNPLDDPGGDGYNSDTHLVYVESTGTLEVWYRYVSDYETTPVSEIIYRQTTKDGINWTEKEIVTNNDSGDYVQYLSPAVIHDGSIYKMWAVNSTENTINYYESVVASPAETIALDNAMSSGAIMQNGNVNTSTDYMHTERIKLNSTKSFQLTGVNLNGVTLHPQLRYVTAYDADGNVLSDYSLQSIPEASVSAGRTITMDDSVDSVIISIYKAQNYTTKTLVLPPVENDGELTKVRDITLNYQDGEKIYKLWHIDVIEDNGKTVLLAMCKSGTEWSLFLSTSDDNVTFTVPKLVMVGNPYGWDTRLYRSCIVNVDGEYRIYYSAQDEIQKYGLGVCTSKTLSNFVGKW